MSSWKVAGDQVLWTVAVPPNTTATLVPASTNAASFTIDGGSLGESKKLHGIEGGGYVLPAGRYTFKATISGGPNFAFDLCARS